MEESVAPVYAFKIVLLGPSNAGKSTVSECYSSEGALPPHALTPTIGVDFKTFNLTVNSRSFKFQVWDTAGQERFARIVEPYYRPCHAIIGVVDLAYVIDECARTSTTYATYDALVAHVVEEQIATVRLAWAANRGQAAVLMLGNKIDKLGVGVRPEEVAPRNALKRIVEEEFGGAYADVSALRNVQIREAINGFFRVLVARWEAHEAETRAAGRKGRPLAPDFSQDAETQRFRQPDRGCAC
jgi:GTPase SAR1 family protein